MQLKAVPTLLALLALTACASSFHLYPVSGPMMASHPVPILHGSMRPPTPGNVSLELPDAEICTGKWVVAPATGIDSNLGPLWDELYGPSYFTAKVLGLPNHGQAQLTGNQGTHLQLDFLFSLPGPWGIGVAQDDKGNVYKVVL